MMQSIALSRLHELEDGVDPVDVTIPSTIHASPSRSERSQPRPAPVEVEVLPAEPPPPLAELSPILPAPPTKPDTQNLETRLRLESRIIDLRGKNKSEASARRHLENDLATMEESRLQDQDTLCEMQQRIHDLEESERLYHERFSQLLATPPLVQVSLSGAGRLGIDDQRKAWC